MRRAYLAGSIFGLSDHGQAWREIAFANVPDGWEFINPNLIELDKIAPIDIVRGDYQTILGCDVLIARVRNPSWGTAMELSFSKAHGVPVIGWPFLRKPVNAINYSPWLISHVTIFSETLSSAIKELVNV